MIAQTIPQLTPQEYLRLERAQPYKSEYLNGEMFAMAGATEAHNTIVTNIVGELRNQLKGRPCKVYPNDMRVRIPRTGLYTYPDVIVVCGKPEFEDEHKDTLPMLERYTRQGDSPFWLFADANGLDAVMEVTEINCRLTLAEVYDKVEWE